MNNEPSPGLSRSEYEAPHFTGEPLLDHLSVELPTSLTQTITALQAVLMNPEIDESVRRRFWTTYAQRFEELANQTSDSETYAQVQIAAALHRALIFQKVGNELRYLEELNVTEIQAGTLGFHDLSSDISSEIDRLTAELGPSPERLILQLRGKIDDDNQIRLWELWAEEQDYEDLVNHAYEMLIEEGEDPDEILAELGVLEP